MQLTPDEETALIARFMPVVLVNVDDIGLPVDPADWVAGCALWSGSRPALDDQMTWGLSASGGARAPLVPRGSLAITTLPQPFRFRGEGGHEFWLERSGWAGGSIVDAASDNRQSHTLSQSAVLSGPTDAVTLRAECCGENGFADLGDAALSSLGLMSGDLAALTKQIVLINYHLLFPGSHRGEKASFPDGTAYDPTRYEGDWTCFSVVLSAPQGRGADGLVPRHAAYGRKWRGQSQSHGEKGTIIGHDLLSWDRAPRVGEHALVLVATGNHNLYPADVAVTPGGGLSIQSGSGWPVADAVVEDVGNYVKKAVAKNTHVAAAVVGVTLAKMAAGAAILGPIGSLIGLVAGIAEAGPIAREIGKDPGSPDVDPTTSKPWDGKLKDPKDKFKSDGPQTKFMVIVPKDGGVDADGVTAGLSFAAATEAKAIWSARSYDRIDRAQEAFWPVHDGQRSRGFVGRWGARCASDPFHRRAGDILPDQRVEVLRHLIAVL